MSLTYSFPLILQSQPPLAVPYDDVPDKEGKARAFSSVNDH
jgi:hypothetical protein